MPAPPSEDELRVALVMTGGVSLAVWMGGVTHEVNRLLHGEGVYGSLLTELRLRPRVDVITGTSAGGLNGALLATAIAHDQDLGHIRTLWADVASLDRLLHEPFKTAPRSLLQGDGVLYPALLEVFGGLVARQHNANLPLRTPDGPIDLTITTTLLDGEWRSFLDDFGGVLHEPNLRGEFRFRRNAPIGNVATGDVNHFTDHAASQRLALAARCSASFPGAFEPRLAPGDGPPPSGEPDMTGISSFRTSQWAVDGGVLVNKPIGPALRRIFLQPADTPVRRVLAYVNPLPSERPAARDLDDDGRPPQPTLLSVIQRSVISARAVESLTDDLDELRAHNRQARDRRRATNDVLRSTHADGGPRALLRLAEPMFAAYRTTRIAGAASHIVECVLEKAPTTGRVYDIRKLRRIVEERSSAAAPWIPRALLASPFRWGMYAVEGVASTVLELVRQAQRLDATLNGDVASLQPARARTYELLHELEHRREKDVRFWGERAEPAFRSLEQLSRTRSTVEERLAAEHALGTWMGDAFDAWTQENDGLEAIAMAFAEVLVGVRARVHAMRDAHADAAPAELSDLVAAVEVLAPVQDAGRCLRLLLALEVVRGALRNPDRLPSQEIELLQLSASATTPLLGVDLPAGTKVLGAQLAHFGAFYRRPWRLRDWAWGRLDGSIRLIQMVLDPRRLRQVGTAADALALVKRLAVDDEPDPDRRQYLARCWQPEEPGIRAELAYVDGPDGLSPASLPACTAALARRAQLQIASDELQALLDAYELEEAEERHRAPRQVVIPTTAAELVDRIRVVLTRSETIGDDLGTDRFTSTATKAAAVVAGIAGNESNGLGVAHRILQPVRGLLVATYLVGLGVTRKSAGMVAAVAGAVAAAAAVLAISIGSSDASRLPSIVPIAIVALTIVGVTRIAFGGHAGAGTLVSFVVVVLALLALPLVLDRDDASGWRAVILDLRGYVLVALLVVGSLAIAFSATTTVARWKTAAALLATAAVLAYVALGADRVLEWWREKDAAVLATELLRPPATATPVAWDSSPPVVVAASDHADVGVDVDDGLVIVIDAGVRTAQDGSLVFAVYETGHAATATIDADRHSDSCVVAATTTCSAVRGRAVVTARSTDPADAQVLLDYGLRRLESSAD